MYIHIFLAACLPAQIFIIFGLGLENITDWVKWSLSEFDYLAFIGGFYINGSSANTTDTFGYSHEITKSMGITACFILAIWLVYATLSIINSYIC